MRYVFSLRVFKTDGCTHVRPFLRTCVQIIILHMHTRAPRIHSFFLTLTRGKTIFSQDQS